MVEPYVTMKDVAKLFGVTTKTIRKYIMLKKLPCRKIGGVWRFKISEVEAWAVTQKK